MFLSGCGGGDDEFSKPSVDIEARLAKARENPPVDAIPDVLVLPDSSTAGTNVAENTLNDASAAQTAPGGESPDAGVAATDSNAQADSGAEVSAAAVTSNTLSTPQMPDSMPAVAETPTGDPAPASADALAKETLAADPADTDSAATSDSRSATPEPAKPEPPGEITKPAPPSGGGLAGLAGLTATESPQGPDLARSGASAGEWNALIDQCSQRYYSAISPGGHFVVTSGSHEQWLVTTTESIVPQPGQLTTSSPVNSPYVASSAAQPGMLRTETEDGILNSVEFTADGLTILLGTTDGKILSRSFPLHQDVDVYAEDLIRFLDEYRTEHVVSDQAVVAIRMVDEQLVLTVDAAGRMACWNASDVISPVISHDQLKTGAIPAPEAAGTATPQFEMDLPSAAPLAIVVSPDRKRVAVVNGNQTLWIVDTADGRVAGSVAPAHIDDAAVISVVWRDDQNLIAALTDGRVLELPLHAVASLSTDASRTTTPAAAGGLGSLAGLSGEKSAPAAEPDDKDRFYKVLYRPEKGVREKAVTALGLMQEDDCLLCGRQDGSVSVIAIESHRIIRTERWHSGPVTTFSSAGAGLLSLCNGRMLVHSDPDWSAGAQSATQTRRQQLTKDAGLSSNRRLAAEKDSPVSLERRVISEIRPVTTTGSRTPAPKLTVRPDDPLMALLQHRLRVADQKEVQGELRTEILNHRGQQSLLPAADQNQSFATPVMKSEITSEFEFSGTTFARILLSISDDGTQLVAVQQASQNTRSGQTRGLYVWDVPTRTPLRWWPETSSAQRVMLTADTSVVALSPFSGQYLTGSGTVAVDPARRYSIAVLSPSRQSVAAGLLPDSARGLETVALLGATEKAGMAGLESFDSVIAALAYSSDGQSLFVSRRERDATRILEVDPLTLNVRSELLREELKGSANPERVDVTRDQLGAVVLAPSPANRTLVTWGRYEKGPELRIWKRAGDRWPEDDVVVISDRKSVLEMVMCDRPICFVNQSDNRIALLAAEGVAVLDGRKGTLIDSLEIPGVGNRRPACVFTPDGKYLLAGDGDGKIWAITLSSLQRKPRSFAAHAAPIAGITLSADGRYLVTAGEENRIRVWGISGFLN
ncbi:MAG: hypothetical protein KDA96_10050 [Planctomycetaceae bacterium]|nr:hypothetical protein [Planctomycetaceae bacterium]